MSLLSLPHVTLCCIDCTPRIGWAMQAIERSMQQVSFAEVILFSDADTLRRIQPPTGVRVVEIESLRSIEAYSHFMIKGLAGHLKTSHMLIVQWDGYVLNASAWDDVFLGYDYIGAPWNHIPEPWKVGNGGFSLRSRKLLDALQSPAIQPSHPEDICICKTYRDELERGGIRFAPVETALRFAAEDNPLTGKEFGFHGPYHMPTVLEPGQVLAFVDSLEPSAVQAHHFGSLLRELRDGARRNPALRPAMLAFRRLILRAVSELEGAASLTPQALGISKALIRYEEFDAAALMLAQRRRAAGWDWNEVRLWLRLKVRSWFAGMRRGST